MTAPRPFWWCLALACVGAGLGAGPAVRPVHAQPTRLTRADGLPSDYLQAVYRDRDGALWLATDAGAVRFDGRSFDGYSVDDGLPHPYVNRFAEESGAGLWARTIGGIAHFDGRRWWAESSGCASGDIGAIGGTLFCLAPRAMFRRHGRWEPFPDSVVALEATPAPDTGYVHGTTALWRLVAGQAPRRVGASGTCAMPVRGRGCRGTVPLVAGQGLGGGVVRERLGPQGRVLALRAVRGTSPSGWMWEVAGAVTLPLSSASDVRYGGGRHLASFVRNARVLDVGDVATGVVERHDLGAGVQDIVFDEAGRLWVATFGRGLVRIDPEMPVRLVEGLFQRFRLAPDGGLWATGPGLWHVNPQGQAAGRRLPLDDDARAVGEGGGDLLVSVEGDLYRSVRGGAPRLVYHDPTWISGLDVEAETLWVSGYESGVHRRVGWRRWMDGRGPKDVTLVDMTAFEPVPGLPTRVIEDLVRLPSGLWALTRSHGALRITGTRLQRSAAEGLPSSAVYAIHESPDGTRWFGTNRGVGRERPGRHPDVLSVPAMTGQRIVGFAEADGGGVWAIGERDLFRIDATGRVTYLSELLPGLTRSVNAARRVGDVLVVATSDGLYRRTLPTPRPVVAPGLALRRVRVDERDVRLVSDVGGAWRLDRLPPGAHRLDLVATPISITDPALTEYRVGDGAWETATDGHVVLPRVPSGAYRVDLRAVARTGGVSAVQTLRFEVAPHWWQRPWVWVALAALVGLALWQGSRRVSERRLRQRLGALEAERRLAAERERISRDLHDHVGGQLTTLASMADLARMQAVRGDAGGAAASLDALGGEARQSLRQLRQTVYALRHPDLTVEALYEQLVAQAEAQTQATGRLELVTLLDAPEPARVVPSPLVLPVLRVAQEAVTNVLRHARAAHIGLGLRVDGDRLTLHVDDDGVGLPPGGARLDGSGVEIMAARAGDLGGTLTVEPRDVGTGTAVTLTVPLKGAE